jgi:hypothetical protein
MDLKVDGEWWTALICWISLVFSSGDEPSGFIRCDVDNHQLGDQNLLKILLIRATGGIPILPFFHSF